MNIVSRENIVVGLFNKRLRKHYIKIVVVLYMVVTFKYH